LAFLLPGGIVGNDALAFLSLSKSPIGSPSPLLSPSELEALQEYYPVVPPQVP
jgi:hypothetical protein